MCAATAAPAYICMSKLPLYGELQTARFYGCFDIIGAHQCSVLTYYSFKHMQRPRYAHKNTPTYTHKQMETEMDTA